MKIPRTRIPVAGAFFIATIGLWTRDVLANSMAPILPLVSILGWFAMPIIVAIEGFYFKKIKVAEPYRLSLYSNLFSASVGLLLAAAGLPLMLGPPIMGDLSLLLKTRPDMADRLLVISSSATVVGFAINWFLSSILEFKFSRWHPRWKNIPLEKAHFFRLNGISYGILFLVFGLRMMDEILKVLGSR
jgi:hypothetical protein